MASTSHSLAPFASVRAPQLMAGFGARGEHVEPDRAPGSVLAIISQRRDLKDRIAILSHRHRRRKSLQRLLEKLTTRQLRAEIKYERQQATTA